MPVLPRSLQQLISGAQKLEPYDSGDDEPDEIMAGVEDYFARLARGEYSEELYWECQGRDFEVDGQWSQALEVYEKILSLDSSSDFDRWQSCNSLAAVYRILGDDEATLQHLQSATHFESSEPRTALWAGSIVSEAWQLLRMGQVAAAIQRLDDLNESPDSISHELGIANMLIARGACSVQQGDARSAKRCLREAKELLVALEAEIVLHGMESAPGVVSAYDSWWAVEAERCRLVGDGKAELRAFRESLQHAEQLASDDPISIVHAEYTVLRRLLSLAAAYNRHGFAEEGAEHRARAEQIRLRRKFPEHPERISSFQPEGQLSMWRQFLNRF